MRFYHKILCTSSKDQFTNEELSDKIQQAIGPHKDQMIVQSLKVQRYGHISHSSGLTKTILQSPVKGVRAQIGQRKKWKDKNTGLLSKDNKPVSGSIQNLTSMSFWVDPDTGLWPNQVQVLYIDPDTGL